MDKVWETTRREGTAALEKALGRTYIPVDRTYGGKRAVLYNLQGLYPISDAYEIRMLMPPYISARTEFVTEPEGEQFKNAQYIKAMIIFLE